MIEKTEDYRKVLKVCQCISGEENAYLWEKFILEGNAYMFDILKENKNYSELVHFVIKELNIKEKMDLFKHCIVKRNDD